MKFSGVLRSMRFFLVFSIVFVAVPATAQVVSNFTGVIDGTEPTFTSPFCSNAPNLYEVLGPLTPSVTGLYQYTDLSISYALDMQIDVYEGNFDPLNPAANYVTGRDDDEASIALTAGTEYYFVVSPLCGTAGTGIWEFELDGPGSVDAPLVAVNVPTLGPISVAIMAVLLGILGTALLWGRRS